MTMNVSFLLLLCIISVIFKEGNTDYLKCTKDLNKHYFIINLPKELTDQLNAELEYSKERAGKITAIVNDYVDKLLDNLQHIIVRNGLDPVELPNNTLNLIPTGTIELSSGWLEDTSTISRSGNVSISYSSSTKKLEVYVPIKFDTLMFTYKYRTHVLLFHVKGDVNGKVKSLKINIKLSFSFEKYQAFLDNFNIADTGSFSLKFSGNGLVDWITNTMTSVVSIFLHPLIVEIMQSMIKGPLQSSVDTVNLLISNILNPTH